MLYLLIAFNLIVSVWNAYVTGLAWFESQNANWFAKAMVWSGGIMSACGFTYCYAAIAALVADHFHWLPHAYAMGILDLAYLAIILPVLGTGLMITVDSVLQAWKTKRVADMGVAAYNVYAQAHNTWDAFSGIGEALEGVSNVFKSDGKSGSSDDDDNSGAALILMVGIAIAALLSGVLTTVFIASKAATYRVEASKA